MVVFSRSPETTSWSGNISALIGATADSIWFTELIERPTLGSRSAKRQLRRPSPVWTRHISGCEVPLCWGASAKSRCRVSRPTSRTQPSAWRRQAKGLPAHVALLHHVIITTGPAKAHSEQSRPQHLFGEEMLLKTRCTPLCC